VKANSSGYVEQQGIYLFTPVNFDGAIGSDKLIIVDVIIVDNLGITRLRMMLSLSKGKGHKKVSTLKL